VRQNKASLSYHQTEILRAIQRLLTANWRVTFDSSALRLRMPWRWPNKLRSRNTCMADSVFDLAIFGQQETMSGSSQPTENGHSMLAEVVLLLVRDYPTIADLKHSETVLIHRRARMCGRVRWQWPERRCG
jgi:hypothetical protein